MLESGNPAIFASGVSGHHTPPTGPPGVLGQGSIWTQPPFEPQRRRSPREEKGPG